MNIEDPVLELQTVGVQLPENYLGDIILNDIPALLEIERTYNENFGIRQFRTGGKRGNRM